MLRLRAKRERDEGTGEAVRTEIERLTAANRSDRDPERERRLLTLRHLAGIRLMEADDRDPRHPDPSFDRLADGSGLPDTAPEDITPELVRAGVLRDGCLLVRGLV
ncbi:MAG TPA: hypothetical protein VE662_06535, partial [Solirubrobacterales bacterium]|nr:hypothetical protein [Solirubrobacterales bacterium]